jgi:hypothetical protein
MRRSEVVFGELYCVSHDKESQIRVEGAASSDAVMRLMAVIDQGRLMEEVFLVLYLVLIKLLLLLLLLLLDLLLPQLLEQTQQ